MIPIPRLPILLIALQWPLLPGMLAVQAELPAEYDVKASCLYSFTQFVDWPPDVFDDARSEFRICVLGHDPFGPALDQVAVSNRVEGRAIKVIRVSELDLKKDYHLLFISRSERAKLARILDSIRGKGILTVGDTAGYAQTGVMINFFVQRNRVRFEINPDAARDAGLRVRSRLLKLATIVETMPADGDE